MKKKNIVFIVIILLLIAGGVFWWKQCQQTSPSEWEGAGHSQPEEYVAIETQEGVIIENEKAGFSFKVPEGWRLEGINSEYGYIHLYSPDAVEKMTLMESGCKISPNVAYIRTDIKTIEEELRNRHQTIVSDEYEIIEFNNHKALKNVMEIESLNLYGIGIHIPIKGEFYEILLDAYIEDKERCSQEFDKFLETVSIK